MLKRIVLIFIALFIIYTIFHFKKVSEVMKYFPIDSSSHFISYETKIKQLNDLDNNFQYSIYSHSNKKEYLRQDVSLLYDNGLYKGHLQSWRENTDEISLQEEFTLKTDSYLQAISFHHGEVHYPDEKIFSIQKMSSDTLVTYFSNDELKTFTSPSNNTETTIMKQLKKQTNKNLHESWTALLRYFNIPSTNYKQIPLVNIDTFFNTQVSNPNIDKVIGQFWEGLYNEYIILLMNKTNEHPKHFMPLVLVAEDESHLIVLFELNNQKHQLIQQISN